MFNKYYVSQPQADRNIAEFPVIPGHEVVGELAAVGKNVKTLKVGDRVVAGALCLFGSIALADLGFESCFCRCRRDLRTMLPLRSRHYLVLRRLPSSRCLDVSVDSLIGRVTS